MSDIKVTESGRATFHKKSALKNGKVIDVIGYLDVVGGKIVSEGDTTTDKNLARAHEVTCEDAVSALVERTPEARRAEKEISDAAEKTPDVHLAGMVLPPEKPGDSWTVAVCEDHGDHMPCFHFFTVDPSSAKVTYTVFGEERGALKTDPTLAEKVRAACK